eukprot:752824-Hanusia_phi.AAC.4
MKQGLLICSVAALVQLSHLPPHRCDRFFSASRAHACPTKLAARGLMPVCWGGVSDSCTSNSMHPCGLRLRGGTNTDDRDVKVDFRWSVVRLLRERASIAKVMPHGVASQDVCLLFDSTFLVPASFVVWVVYLPFSLFPLLFVPGR